MPAAKEIDLDHATSFTPFHSQHKARGTLLFGNLMLCVTQRQAMGQEFPEIGSREEMMKQENLKMHYTIDRRLMKYTGVKTKQQRQ